jgi:uroporphyrinogen decarboxylase
MNGRERILCALRREVPDTVPIFEWFIDASVGQALVGSGDIIDIVDRLDLDGINLRPTYGKRFLDDTTFVDEWGMKRQLTGDVLPAVLESPIPDITRHRDYSFPDPQGPDRFSAIDRALERFGDRKAIILNLRDGFSDMRDLLGYEGSLMTLLLEPQAYAELLERAVLYNLAVAEVARKRYGLKIVATTDDIANATGMLISPHSYFERIAPQFRQAMEGYKALGYLCIKHCDGNIDAVSDFWVECGIDCLDPIDPCGGYTIGGMKAKYGAQICLKGNIDCTGALCDGTPQDVELEVRQCLRDGAPGGGYILSSSNTIHKGVQPQNFQAMLQALRDHGQYPATEQ